MERRTEGAEMQLQLKTLWVFFLLLMDLFVPEQLRALACVAGEDLERGLNFIRGCFDLKASLAEKQNELVEHLKQVTHLQINIPLQGRLSLVTTHRRLLLIDS